MINSKLWIRIVEKQYINADICVIRVWWFVSYDGCAAGSGRCGVWAESVVERGIVFWEDTFRRIRPYDE